MTRVAVIEGPPELVPGSPAWDRICRDVRETHADAVLMNEMPFGPWIATSPNPDPATLARARSVHDEGLGRVADLGTPHVLVTRPAADQELSVHEALVWSAPSAIERIHTKQFFPDEPGFYEAKWWAPGTTRFGITSIGALRVGFLICTDVQFLEWARSYGRRGAHLIAVPRATPVGSMERWRTVIRAAAITSGCYVASANRRGTDVTGLEFAGGSWIVAPSGDVIAETTGDDVVAVAEVDASVADSAKLEYPCYVSDRESTAETHGPVLT